MSRKSIGSAILKPIVADQPDRFTTKDVSEDERVRSRHPELVGHCNYHAFLGGALSDHHVELGIIKLRTTHRRGMTWQRQARGA